MKRQLAQSIKQVVRQEFGVDTEVELTRPEEAFGDYATNVALQLAKKVGQNPRQIAEKLVAKLKPKLKDQVSDVQVAGPGFINIKLSDEALVEAMLLKPGRQLAGKVVVAEYSDPNPFKILHAGHLYTSIVGDAIANLAAQAGAKVHRVNFGGDVGLHVAKCLWAVLKKLEGENPQKLDEIKPKERSDWLSQCYVEGHTAYDDKSLRPEFIELNKRIYQIHADNDHSSNFAKIYWQTRQWSYDYFEEFYARLGIKFEKYYPESETAELGIKTVKAELQNGVYKQSDGAIVFEGEPHGLHTRVFINSEGLPTYEAKDVGLILKKDQDFHFDSSIVITANDIAEYMKVVLKSIEQFKPELAKRTTHLTHGMVRLAGGVKMSSRLGNILKATDVLDAAAEASRRLVQKEDEQTVIGAVKYSFIKQRLGGDIIYDPDESVSIEGNSGPYLQYAHARARSILAKTSGKNSLSEVVFEPGERTLARKISEYAEVVDQATQELMPHHIATYLYELAQIFNRFYEANRVVGGDREKVRAALINHYANTLKSGLGLLGIAAPDKM